MGTKSLIFTMKNIEGLSSPATGRQTYRDDKSRYLQLQILPSGRKTFYYYRKINGRPCRLKIGSFPETTVTLARKKAEQVSGQVAVGHNPGDEKWAYRKEMTFKELFDSYITLYAKNDKRTWAEDQRKFDKILFRWANLKVREVDSKTIMRLKTKIGNEGKKYLFNRTYALIHKVFNFGIENLKLNISNPCVGIKKFPEEARDRFMDGSELEKFFKALNSEPDVTWRHFFLIVLFTGARRGNVASMEWNEIDMENAVWTIPADKAKTGQTSRKSRPIKIVLSPPVMEILKIYHRNRDDSSPYVFRKDTRTGHILEPRRAWQRILKQAKIKNLRIHDLRRTLGSWQAAAGASLHIIGKSLGHNDIKTTQIYARLNLDPVRESVETAVNSMLNTVKSSSKTTNKKDGK